MGLAVFDSAPIDMLPNEVLLVFALMRKSRPDARIEDAGSALLLPWARKLFYCAGRGMPPRSSTFGVC